MPKSAVVTPESVRSAAAELVTAGQQPSVRKVRDMLGGGNPNTIHAILRDVRNEALATPTPLDEAVTRAIRAQIASARQEACAELQERLKTAEADVASFTASDEAKSLRIDELTKALANAEAQHHRLLGQLEEARAHSEQLQVLLDRTAETYRREAAEMRDRLAATEQAKAVAEIHAQHEREMRAAMERRLVAVDRAKPSPNSRRKLSGTGSS